MTECSSVPFARLYAPEVDMAGPSAWSGKRAFDLLGALLLGSFISPIIAIIALAILVQDGRPIFYVSRRMKGPARSFALIKLRTMRGHAGPAAASGGHIRDRITPLGHVLRKTRADELPQLYNILRGDMSFVGPRPPLPSYVARFPDLYEEVLRCKPGVTGLASLIYHRKEEALLSKCRTPVETDALYTRICVPRKAKLDMVYQRNQSLRLDLWVMAHTVVRVLKR